MICKQQQKIEAKYSK